MKGGKYKAWYAENSARVNKKRKARYHKDPAFRARSIELARAAYYRKRAKAGPSASRVASKPVLIPEKCRYGYRSMAFGGDPVRVASIEYLARRLGVGAQAIRVWEWRGWIPATPWRDDNGKRWYSQEYVGLLLAVKRTRPIEAWSRRVWEKYRTTQEGGTK